MPHPCCVPGCNGNYKTGPKVRVFSFPKQAEESARWLHAIKRENFVVTPHSKVCELHFEECDFQQNQNVFDEKTGSRITIPYERPKLIKGRIPSKFPNLAPYFSSSPKVSREDPNDRKKRLEEDALRIALEKSIAEQKEYELKRTFSSLEELNSKTEYIDSALWTVIKKSDKIIFVKIVTETAPVIECSIVINNELCITNAYVYDKEVHKFGKYSLPLIVNHIDTLINILKDLNDSVKGAPKNIISTVCDLLKGISSDQDELLKFHLKFIEEQLSLCFLNKNGLRYSSDILIFSSLFFSMAPHAYHFVRKSGNIVLPHPCTIRRLCLSFNVKPDAEKISSNFLLYIKQKFSLLKETDKKVILMIDEIHLKEFLDFKGGNICGLSYDNQNMANSAHVFMINSLMSSYKDVVHILPVQTITAETLHDITRKIIIGLEKIGFFVFCVSTDNNSINRKCISLFVSPPKIQIVYPHPCDKSRPLFYVVDTVHLFKCIRNNWINQKNSGKCMYFPSFNNNSNNLKTASWNTLKEMHKSEFNSLVKYGFNISYKALNPSNLERQNVKLVTQIFNDYVINGLLEVGKQKNLVHFQDTSDFIRIIVNWWNIVNVKTPYKGIRLNNVYQTPLTYSVNDEKIKFLNSFSDWLEQWETFKCDTGIFTRETHSALKLSTHSLLELASYCTSELNLDYILPGKFQTDNLESRFGLYRQLSGSQYHISIRQLFEAESKLRIQSLLKFPKLSDNTFNSSQDFDNLDIECVSNSDFKVTVNPSDINLCKEFLPVIIYVAGYCAFTVLKHLKCSFCENNLLRDKTIELNSNFFNYLNNLDRGGLSCPSDDVINIVLINYIIVKKLCSEFESLFLKTSNQRNVALSISRNIIMNEELFEETVCDSGHCNNKIINMILWSSTNIFLNNYCKVKNDTHLQNVKNKKISSKNSQARTDTVQKLESKEISINKRKLSTLT